MMSGTVADDGERGLGFGCEIFAGLVAIYATVCSGLFSSYAIGVLFFERLQCFWAFCEPLLVGFGVGLCQPAANFDGGIVHLLAFVELVGFAIQCCQIVVEIRQFWLKALRVGLCQPFEYFGGGFEHLLGFGEALYMAVELHAQKFGDNLHMRPLPVDPRPAAHALVNVGPQGLGQAHLLNDGVETFCGGIVAVWSAVDDKEVDIFSPPQTGKVLNFLSYPNGLGGVRGANHD